MSLTTDLTKLVKDALKDYEQHREKIKDLAIDWLNADAGPAIPNPPPPTQGPYLVINDAVARVTTVHGLVKAARDAAGSKVYRWVSPRLAAIAFEGVFDACLAVWLAAGPPVPLTPNQLRPAVDRFVDWQVGLFTAAIEGR